jgi:rubredoxin
MSYPDLVCPSCGTVGKHQAHPNAGVGGCNNCGYVDDESNFKVAA